MSFILKNDQSDTVLDMDMSELNARVEKLESWSVTDDGKSITKHFAFEDFERALAFTNKVGALSEAENHHPDIALSWGKVGITLSTHSAGGLTEKDFELAKKIDALAQ